MQRLISVLHWLTKPVATLPETHRRRANLLAWLLLLIILMAMAALILVLIVVPPNNLISMHYIELILTLMILLTLAYGLNRAGHYYMAASLAVACVMAGPWVSLALDPTMLHGDFVPLAYVALSVLLSSILLPPAITTILAVLQWIGLLAVLFFGPAKTSFNWPGFLLFIFFTSALSILFNILYQRDLDQIDRQTRLLSLSEAQLREQSIRDHLTTLFNRRYLEETLEREVQRASRKQLPLGIIMMDIDHFKGFNDTLGHAAGDTLFRELGKLLREQIRAADIACRYGGDEFVLVLPEASLEVTKKRAEVIRDKVKQLRLEHNNQLLGTMTISSGVAVFPDHGSTGEAVLKSADAALYRAKREGRDRIAVAD